MNINLVAASNDTFYIDDNQIDSYSEYYRFVRFDIFNDEDIKLGYIEGVVFSEIVLDAFKSDSIYDIIDEIDRTSSEYSRILEFIEEHKKYKNKISILYGLPFYLEGIYLEKEFRGNKIGKAIINLIDQVIGLYTNLTINSIFLFSDPFYLEEFDEDEFDDVSNEELQNKLNQFYIKNGFTHHPCESGHVMAKFINRK